MVRTTRPVTVQTHSAQCFTTSLGMTIESSVARPVSSMACMRRSEESVGASRPPPLGMVGPTSTRSAPSFSTSTESFTGVAERSLPARSNA
jgi:hypothetical protein